MVNFTKEDIVEALNTVKEELVYEFPDYKKGFFKVKVVQILDGFNITVDWNGGPTKKEVDERIMWIEKAYMVSKILTTHDGSNEVTYTPEELTNAKQDLLNYVESKYPDTLFKIDTIQESDGIHLHLSWEGSPSESDVVTSFLWFKQPSFVKHITYKQSESKKEKLHTIYEPAKETAKKIRKRLKQEFPEYPTNHFKVTTSVYSGGSSISIRWIDLPAYKEVNDITQQYKSASFDGMIDMETIEGYIDPEDGLLYSGAGYVSAQQELSDEREEAIQKYMKDKYNEEDLKEYDIQHKARREANERLGRDNQLNERFNPELFGKRNFKEDINQYVNTYLDKVPTHLLEVPYSAMYLVGEENKGSNTVKLGEQLDFRKRAQLEIEKKLTVEFLSKLAEDVTTLDDYEKEIDYTLSRVVIDTLKPIISTEIYRQLVMYFSREVSGNIEKLKQYSQHKVLVDNYIQFIDLEKIVTKKEFYLYTKLNLNMRDKTAGEHIKDHVNRLTKLFLEDQKELLNQGQKQSTQVTPEELVTNTISDFYVKLSNETKVRLVRIINKNSHEVLTAARNSPNLIKSANADKLLIAKYESTVDKSKVFYQTPFGLWVYYEKEGQPRVEALYRLGIDSIADSVKIAKNVVAKYHLNTGVLWFANKMYLRN